MKKKKQKSKKLMKQKNDELQNTDNVQESIPEIMENIANSKELPGKQMAVVEESLTMMSVMQNNTDSVIAKKITEEHIDKFLDATEERTKLEFKDNTQQRIFSGIIFTLVIILIIVVVVIFKDTPDVIDKIIIALGGLLGGYGLGKAKKD